MIEKLGVAGSGLMGAGIAQVAAQSGYEVRLLDVDEERVADGLARIEMWLGKAVEKDKLSEADKDAALARIAGTTRLEDLETCTLIIEAITESFEAKRELFTALHDICGQDCIFASNTSSLSITELGAASGRPERFVGLHFFNPVPVMQLVELVRTLDSADEVFAAAKTFGESLGKTVVVAQDTPGFVVNRLLIPYLLDAIRALEAGVASKEDIDAGMMLGCGYPMGPLTLVDFVGLDTTQHVAEIMFAEFKDARYAAPPLLRRMVQAGRMGKKSGRGFYDYE